MLALNTQTKGSHVSPSDFNQMPLEIQNIIEDTGITLIDGVISQLAQAISNYVTHSMWYTGAGTAADQTLTSIGNVEGPDAYEHGMRVFWRPSNDSVNGGTTIDVNGMGQKDLLQEDGTPVTDTVPDLDTDKDAEARYDTSAGAFFLIGA